MKSNIKFVLGIVLIFIFLVGVGSSYMGSSSKLIEGRTSAFQVNELVSFNTDMCQDGTDFVVQIPPLGCTPTVVRSDLLEEQDVPVFCELSAIKINPLINIDAIDSINFAGEYPPEVRTVGFHPSYSALGENRKLNNLMWDNIGYAVIWLRQQPNESALTNCRKEGLSEVCYVSGNLSAKIRYDLEGAFGLRRHSFYLPAMTDSQFSSRYGQYAFFDRRGFLRAENVDNDGASIVIYSGRNENLVGMSRSGQNDKQKIAELNLDVGETSSEMFLPGFDCLATVKFRLEDVESADTRANLLINNEPIEVKEDETFLDNKCEVVEIERMGFNQVVKLKCRGDEGWETIYLRVTPSINLSIDGVSKNYRVGEYLFNTTDGKYVYLGYVTTEDEDGFESGKVEDLGAYLIAIPENVSVLGDDELRQAASLFSRLTVQEGNLVDYAHFFSGSLTNFWFWMQAGTNFIYTHFDEGVTLDDRSIEILGFGEIGNLPLEKESADFYNSALDSYDTVINSYYGERYNDYTSEAEISLDERALRGKIELANLMNQKDDVRLFCEEFMSLYPETILDISICEDLEKMSNTEISTADVLIDGNWKRISLQRIYEPSLEDYGIEINVRNKNGVDKDYKIGKDGTVLLTDFVTKDMVFQIDSSEFGKLYFKYLGEWKWSPDRVNWMENLEVIFNDGGIKKVPSSEDLALIKSLNGVEFSQGSKILLREEGKLDSIKLIEVHEDEAVIEFNLYNKSSYKAVYDFLGSKKEVLEKGRQVNFGSDYTFTVKDIYLKQFAKVSVIPDINYAGSTVDFSFNVGVEKRAIQLSPEKTQERVDKLNKTIEQWRKRSESLGDVVETMKTACLGVGAALTVKNLVGGAGGKTIARQEVMYGSGGWYEQCGDKEYNGQTYSSEEDCLFENANLIDDEVNEITTEMNSQNKKIKELQEPYTEKKLLGQNVVNTAEFVGSYSEQVKESIDWLKEGDGVYTEEEVNLVNVQGVLDEENWGKGIYSVEQAKKIELYSNLLEKDPTNEAYKSRLLGALKAVEVNRENMISVQSLQDNIVQDGLSKSVPRIYVGEGTKKEIYDGDLVPSKPKFVNMPVGKPVQTVVYDNTLYYLTLNPTENNQYYIDEVYLENKSLVSNELSVLIKASEGVSNSIKGKYSYFVEYDKKSYENPYDKNNPPKLTYYETDPYKGLPAMVPFDAVHGWYAYVKQTIPTGRTIRAYDDSGKVNSFWLCNVGKNRIAQFENDLGDDICEQINLGTGQPYNQFPHLKTPEAKELVSEAEEAIFQASRAYGDGVKRVKILDETVEVGSPALDIPGIKCTDYMSPKECKLLFNVCDPVICPNSRCDFGGAYPVPDVIQSGIIGSIALCLPNFNEGIYVPVCLTGVKAGVDGYLSIAEAYKDCLAHNLETGETIGVCDEIHSIYLCEFFWRQAFPLAKLAIPKLLGILSGQNSRGGGEYMGVAAAWENAKDSISYFTQYYAANSYKAFKARSTEEVGSAACGSFVSVAYPNGQGVLDVLTESDSPPQFNAKFDSIPFTTTTVPPVNQYKVFYHIYAGNDRGAYYKVYLRGEPGSSYFQGTGFGKSVASGYIARGEYASETKDFTAPEGYTELCVVVNDQEECRFGQVTSNFALDYIKDQYLENQATSKDIKTEGECISGSPNVYSLLNPNLEEGVDSLIDPAIYEKGLIRICSTDSPGSGSDPLDGREGSKWLDVGYCGDEKIRCWIDQESIADAVEFETTYNKSLNELTKHYTEEFIESKGYLTPENFSIFLDSLKAEEYASKKIKLVENIFDKVFLNNQRGYLYYLLGGFYGEIAVESFNRLDLHKLGKKDFECVDASVGPRIFSVAESKIGEDTTRYEDGGEVYDRVCATFVSKVLFETGALTEGSFCTADGVKYTQAIQQLIDRFNNSPNFVEIKQPEWEKGLKKGDVVILGTPGKGYTHIVIFENYSGETGISYIHDGGRSTRISRSSIPDIMGTNWYVVEVWRAGCLPKIQVTKPGIIEEREIGEMSGVSFIEAQEGPKLFFNGLTIICYKYFDGEWHWSTQCDEVDKAGSAIEWISAGDIEDPYRVTNPGEGDRAIILSLYELDLEEGIFEAIDVVVRGEKNHLETGSVWMTPSKVFYLIGEEMSFVYVEENSKEGWYWSTEEKDYDGDLTNWIKSPNVPAGYSQINNLENYFIKELGNLDYKGGLQLLLWFDRDKYDEKGIISSDRLNRLEWTLESAMCTIFSLEGFPSDGFQNEQFISELYFDGILSESQYNDIMGKDGSWFTQLINYNGEESMQVVGSYLADKSRKDEGKWTYLSALSKLKSFDEIKYVDEPVLIRDWNSNGLISENIYEYILQNKKSDLYSKLENYFESNVDCDGVNQNLNSGIVNTGGGNELSCNSVSECQKVLGNVVYEIAEEKKPSYVKDSDILRDTGYKNFECLVLGVAMQESNLQQCKSSNSEENPLYCEVDLSQVITGPTGDIGIMQINLDGSTPSDIKEFESNVEFGVYRLGTEKYNSVGSYFETGRTYNCLNKQYSGWQLVLRYYNGWSPNDCSLGDQNYVENVLSQRSNVESLFPSLCA